MVLVYILGFIYYCIIINLCCPGVLISVLIVETSNCTIIVPTDVDLHSSLTISSAHINASAANADQRT